MFDVPLDDMILVIKMLKLKKKIRWGDKSRLFKECGVPLCEITQILDRPEYWIYSFAYKIKMLKLLSSSKRLKLW